MLFLLFRLGADRYALEAGVVAEILPFVGIKQIPQAPPGVAGVLDYRGTPVPVIDLSHLTLGRPASARLSTRIVIVDYPAGLAGRTRPLGLIAEHATETLRREPTDFVPSGVDVVAAPYLGGVATDPGGLVQRIDLGKLLPNHLRDRLFTLQTAP